MYYREVHDALPTSDLRAIQKRLDASDGYETLTYLRQMKERGLVDEPREQHFERV